MGVPETVNCCPILNRGGIHGNLRSIEGSDLSATILIGAWLNDLADVKLFCDNVGAQKLVANPVFHSRTKHIDIRHHFVREAVKNHCINLTYTPTEDMGADVLTKGLSGPKHRACLDLLGQTELTHNEEEC